MKRSPILVMYNALISIGVYSSSARNDYRTPAWRLAEIDRVVGAALTEMNGEHTKVVQKALGIGEPIAERKVKR